MNYILVFIFFMSIMITGCDLSKKENKSVDIDKKNLVDTISNQSDVILEVNTDTVIFQQYMDYGDFNRFHVTVKRKDLYPINDSESRNLVRGDTAILQWKKDSVWIPESPHDKWITEISLGIRKIKNGKLFLYREKHPKPITFYCENEIKERYSQDDFDEIYNLVGYYLVNSKNKAVKMAVENRTDSTEIQYSIEEQDREESGIRTKYTVIGLSNYFENHNSIFQWLYIKRSNYGYKNMYEYDLPNDKLVLLN